MIKFANLKDDQKYVIFLGIDFQEFQKITLTPIQLLTTVDRFGSRDRYEQYEQFSKKYAIAKTWELKDLEAYALDKRQVLQAAKKLAKFYGVKKSYMFKVLEASTTPLNSFQAFSMDPEGDDDD